MRAERLLHLLSLLDAGGEVSARELAERFDVTERTVRRDIAELRRQGFDIESVGRAGGGYALRRGSRLPPRLFDEEQVMALAIALQAAPPVARVAEGAARALATVRQLLPERLAAVADRIALDPMEAGPALVDVELLTELAARVRREEVAVLGYRRAPEGPVRRCRLEPHHLLAHEGRWHLIAWDLDRDEWCVHRLDRLEPTGEPGRRFARRELPAPPHEFLRERLEGGAYPCVGTAVLELPLAEAMRWADDEWRLEAVDGGVRITASAWTWRALAARFALYDAPFSVERPEELRLAAVELALRLRAAADGPTR